MSNRDIIVTGSLAYDRIMDFPGRFSDHILPGKTHLLNVAFTVKGLKESFGGTAGNIAYNLSLLGERPKLIGVAGNDFFKYENWLKKNKIDVTNLKIVKDQPTASAYIMTDQADNQITAFYPGSEIQTPPQPLLSKERGKNAGGNTLAIVAPDYVARMVKYVKIFKRRQVPYIFDPGQQITSLKAGELKFAITGAKVLVGNDYEIQLILDKLSPHPALPRFVPRGRGDNVRNSDRVVKKLAKMVEILVITKGAKGSVIFKQDRRIKIPAAKPRNTSDPTGAGDAYRAGLIKGLVQGWPMEKVGRLASLVAVYTVEKYGTQTHHFTWKELERRYRENYGEKL